MLFLALLDQVPFFWDFTSEEKALFAANENFFATFSDKEYLITEGEMDDDLFILIKGKVDVTTNSLPDRILVTLDTGAVIGEISYLTKRKRATNIIANGDAIAFRINRETLEKEHVESSLIAKISDQLIEILVRRLEETNQALATQKETNAVLTQALSAKYLDK